MNSSFIIKYLLQTRKAYTFKTSAINIFTLSKKLLQIFTEETHILLQQAKQLLALLLRRRSRDSPQTSKSQPFNTPTHIKMCRYRVVIYACGHAHTRHMPWVTTSPTGLREGWERIPANHNGHELCDPYTSGPYQECVPDTTDRTYFRTIPELCGPCKKAENEANQREHRSKKKYNSRGGGHKGKSTLK